jgi:hypothetical protein
MEQSIYNKLRTINVNDKVEKKNGLSYLPWAYAWDMVKKIYPSVQRHVFENESGMPYFGDHTGGMVKVGITIDGHEQVEWLAIRDFRNKSVAIDKITTGDIEVALQRCGTKAIARHGLGMYIYAGEDVPQEVIDTMIKDQLVEPGFKETVDKLASDGFKEAKEDGGMNVVVRTKWLKDMASKAVPVDTVMSKMKEKYKISKALEKSLTDEYIGYLATAKG